MLNGLKLNGPAFLASVTTAAEAAIVLLCGADIIDGKDPSRGALGALSLETIRAIVRAVDGRAATSATIGDLPSSAANMVPAAQAVASTGVDFVKAGFFGDGPHREAIAALGAADLGRARLAGVLMADLEPDFELIGAMAKAGFAGVMLDTAGKAEGGLRHSLTAHRIAEFVRVARSHNLVCGLAGSLGAADIEPLIAFGPGILGFRGALCAGGRTGTLDAARVHSIATAVKFPATQPSERSRNMLLERPLA